MSATKCHWVSIASKNLDLGECSEPRKFNVSERRINPKLEKLEEFFPGEEYRELAIKKPEKSIKQ